MNGFGAPSVPLSVHRALERSRRWIADDWSSPLDQQNMSFQRPNCIRQGLYGLFAICTLLFTLDLASGWFSASYGSGWWSCEFQHGSFSVVLNLSSTPWPRREWHMAWAETYSLRTFEVPWYQRLSTPLADVVGVALAPVILLFVAIGLSLYWHNRRRMTRRGFCSTCGYNLRGNVSGICPECGRNITHTRAMLQSVDASRSESTLRVPRNPDSASKTH